MFQAVANESAGCAADSTHVRTVLARHVDTLGRREGPCLHFLLDHAVRSSDVAQRVAFFDLCSCIDSSAKLSIFTTRLAALLAHRAPSGAADAELRLLLLAYTPATAAALTEKSFTALLGAMDVKEDCVIDSSGALRPPYTLVAQQILSPAFVKHLSTAQVWRLYSCP